MKPESKSTMYVEKYANHVQRETIISPWIKRGERYIRLITGSRWKRCIVTWKRTSKWKVALLPLVSLRLLLLMTKKARDRREREKVKNGREGRRERKWCEEMKNMWVWFRLLVMKIITFSSDTEGSLYRIPRKCRGPHPSCSVSSLSHQHALDLVGSTPRLCIWTVEILHGITVLGAMGSDVPGCRWSTICGWNDENRLAVNEWDKREFLTRTRRRASGKGQVG